MISAARPTGSIGALFDLVQLAARLHPSKTAIIAGPERIGFAELEDRALRIAALLQRSGARPGDRVVVCGANGIDVCASFWGALAATCVPVVLDPGATLARMAEIVRDCAPAVILVDRVNALKRNWATPGAHVITTAFGDLDAPTVSRMNESAGPSPDPNLDPSIDLAAIIYTSGTNGEAKGVMLTNHNMLAASQSISQYLELTSDDVVLCTLPLAFDYGLYQLILSVCQGATLVLEPGFHLPRKVLARIEEHRVTLVPVVPTMLSTWDRFGPTNRDLRCVRAVTSTAAMLSPRHIAIARSMFPAAQIFSMYGLTECKRCTYLPPAYLDAKPGSVGIAIPHTEMWAQDPDGRRLGPYEEGELVVSGATVMAGYWANPDATAACLRPGPVRGGRILLTGDIGFLDADGFVYLRGRVDDVVKCHGLKVAPAEIEAVLLGVDGVADAVVVAQPDAQCDTRLTALVVPESSAQESEGDSLIERCRAELRARLESHKVPGVIELRDAITRDERGKVRRALLADQERDRS